MSENNGEIPKSNEQCDESFADLKEKPPTVPIRSVQLMMLEKIIEKQNEQEKLNQGNQQKILEQLEILQNQSADQSKIMEKLESMEGNLNSKVLESQQIILDRLESIEDRLDDLEDQIKSVEEPVGSFIAPVPVKSDKQEKQMAPSSLKHFVLKHTFKNVSGLKEKTYERSEDEEYSGVTWYTNIYREDDKFSVYFYCKAPEDLSKWSIQTNFECKAIHPDGKACAKEANFTYCKNTGYGWPEFLKWNDLEKDYLDDDELKIEVHVKILSTSGIYKENLKSFDDPECSDIVLIVENKRFHVAKLYLASHSTYFKAMILGMFGESKKSEIELSDVDPDDFQKYLEVLYAEHVIDEFTVEGILMVADMYDTQLAVRKCEEFLLEKSKKTMKKKLQMSIRYNLEKLKKKCLAEMKTVADIRSILPSNFREMDSSIIADLLEKSLSFK